MSLGCPDEIPFSELAARLRGRGAAERIPLTGSWDLTERCNLTCAHCYINRPAADALAARRELPAGRICSILDEIAAEGCLWLTFTGGEPLLRPDWLEIYRHAKKLGLLVKLFTNGTLLTPAIADELAEWRPYKVEITLYGATPETYERVSGVQGSYARCMRGIDLLLDRGLPLALKTMVLTLNQHELPAMTALAQDRGTEFRWDSELTPRLDGGKRNQAVMLSVEESAALDTEHPDRAAEWRMLVERDKEWRRRLEQREIPYTEPDSLYRCGAGLRSFHIDAYGGLALCGLARRPAYDLAAGTFREGWHQFLARARQQRRLVSNRCWDCGIAVLCKQCAGWSQLENGDTETPVDYLCAVAHRRASVLTGQ